MKIKNSTIRTLAELAHTAPSADNSQPWRLNWDGDYLTVGYDTERVLGKTFPADSPATVLSIGAVVEIIMMVAEDWNLEPYLQLNSPLPNKDSGLYARIQFQGSDQNSAPDIASHTASQRHTNRLPYLKRSITRVLCSELESMSENSARIEILSNAEDIKQTAAIATRASQIRFQTREVHGWLRKSLRFTPESASKGDGLDVATLGLPMGGKQFLRLISPWSRMRLFNKMGVYKVVSKIDSAPLKSATQLITVIARSDTQGAFDAGRLLSRTWILLNSQGLSAHPYYVIADQLARIRSGSIPENLLPLALSIEQASNELFKLGKDETLHMLLRVGYAKKSPQLSQRLPFKMIYNEKSHL